MKRGGGPMILTWAPVVVVALEKQGANGSSITGRLRIDPQLFSTGIYFRLIRSS